MTKISKDGFKKVNDQQLIGKVIVERGRDEFGREVVRTGLQQFNTPALGGWLSRRGVLTLLFSVHPL